MSDTFETLVGDLGGVGALAKFDVEAVRAVAGLLDRAAEARHMLEIEGVTAEGREHPACLTERTALAEVRGWVKERPDLFGKRLDGVESGDSEPSKLAKFKVVE